MRSDGKYPLEGCENLQLLIQMQLSGKPKSFSQFFVPFVESTTNFKNFDQNMIVIANVFPKLKTVKIVSRPLPKWRRFRTFFDSEHVKSSLKACEISIRAL